MRFSIFVAFAGLAGLVALPSAAHAFADASQFFDQKASPHSATFGASGEGLYFTGAPRFASLECSSCHAGGPQKVGLQLNADDATLFSAGYQPGKTYELQVELTNESEGLMYKTPTCTDPPAPGDMFSYVQCNNNGFALEIDSAGIPLAGPSVYCAAQPKAGMCPVADFTADQALVAPDGDAVFDAKVYSADPNMPKLVTRNGADSWRFWWTAPKAGTGPLTVYVAAVDGNGGAGTIANDQDPYDDDTVAANFFLQEAGVPVKNSASAGCSLAPVAGRAAAWWLLVPVLLLARRRRGRLVSELSRRGFLEVAAVAGCGALLLGGCQNGGPVAGSVTPTNGMALLPFAMFPQLSTIGDGVVVDIGNQPIAVIRTADTTATALSAVCTHSGCTVEIQSGSPPLYCPCHGSEFSLGGVAVHGPARTSLRLYTATVDATGVTVTIA